MPDQKAEFSQWFTPLPLARKIASCSWVAGRYVLEPTAGNGVFVQAALEFGANHVFAVERDPEWAEYLKVAFEGERVTVLCADFLDEQVIAQIRLTIEPFNPIALLNPPYEKHGEALFTENCFLAGCSDAVLLARVQALHNTTRHQICFGHRPLVWGARLTRRPWFGASSSGKFSEYAVTRHRCRKSEEAPWPEFWETWTDDSWTKKKIQEQL